jgi:hypothetical protein
MTRIHVALVFIILRGHETSSYCVNNVVHTCKMPMKGAMELLALEELSKKKK